MGTSFNTFNFPIAGGVQSHQRVGGEGEDKPETPDGAAQQFEEVLVRQFVQVITKDMFSSSLSGDDGGTNWMQSQRDRQRKMMTDMIAEQIAKAGDLQISEKLVREWGQRSSASPSGDPEMPDRMRTREDEILRRAPQSRDDSSIDPADPIIDSHIDHAV